MTHAPMPKPSAGRNDGSGAPPRTGGSGKGGGKDGGSRRDRLASFEKARKAEQRRRTILLLGICVVVAAALLAYPVYLVAKDSKVTAAGLSAIGATLADAGCDPVQENQATGNQEHVAEGTKVTYDQSPPDSGKHYPSPAAFTKHFYSTDDRPQLETLVHNLEHGYTIAWYRADAPAEDVNALRQAAGTFGSETYDPSQKFIAAPYSSTDGAFPDGKDVVLARWTANPQNPSDQTQQKGVRQSCTKVSGAAITDFMAKYPVANSPEPNGA
ncbi:DUF3105 domain-containing protein [Microlunatus flavus]|uniref:DUF3105 domain-containing protein n=1 Tax=Microlunatus flavus TaxID=1036181 RepID=A0A1H9CHA8_9ACTN|nr:DUF3105 domain-containing protein [Microlunatus flavus]SEQ00596.1 Protein of unknown function [Microlunatus flavus]